MPHLTLEDLARVADEAPLPHEAAHLRDCLVCRRELAEMRAQTALLGALDDPEPPAAAWAALEAELLAQGLMRTRPRGWAGWTAERPWLRIAAGIALFLLGGAAGAVLWARASAPDGRVQALPGSVAVAQRPAPPAVATPTETSPDARPAVDAGDVRPRQAGDARFASTGAEPPRRATDSPAARRAERELADAEAAYLAALQRYAAIADPASGADADTRMDALDRMIATTRDALERAPADPVINGYHLAAVREREDLRRQMAAQGSEWF